MWTARVSLVAAALLSVGEARQGQKGRSPLMGWNTWCTQNTCGVDWCTSSEVLDVAKTIKENGMLALGYDHINLDDCWGERNSTTGQIEGDPVRFPEGMPAFIAKLHDMGFKFGLYTDIGPNGCHHPFTGSFPYYQRDANTFKEWNVDYVKFDGCDLPSGYTPEQLTCNMSNALLNTGDDFWFNFHCWHTDTCATCGTSFRVYDDHHDNWGSTSGVIKFLQNRQPFWGPNPQDGWPDPDFIYTGGQGCNSTDPGPNHGNPGPSPPGVRCPGQTEDEYISEFSIWAIAGGQIVLSSDPRNMSDFQKKVLFNTEILNVFNDTSGFKDVKMVGDGNGTPVGPTPITPAPNASSSCKLLHQASHAKCIAGKSFDCDTAAKTMWTSDGCRGEFDCAGYTTECNVDGDGKHTCDCKNAATGGGQVWVRPTADGGAAVALHNGGTVALKLTVQFDTITGRSWTAGTELAVRDVWAHADVGVSTGSYSAVVRSHGTEMFKLTAPK
eukprot:m.1076987 g.1076987  ORF g.1076987 m.1076987 type:complete len:497 (+) comp24250_c0_seq5:69-1559(+)